jgi:hypothetical protein
MHMYCNLFHPNDYKRAQVTFFGYPVCAHPLENATFAEYSCPIRLKGPRYLYLNVAVEKRNISGV